MLDHPDRVWRLQGASNFRDLGGYLGHDQRPLRWRRLFRSDHLGGLTDADKVLLAGLGLSRSFDFRGAGERAATPYELPQLTQHSLAIEPTVVQHLHDLAKAGHTLTAAVTVALMEDLYRALVTTQSGRFAELFEHLLDGDTPLLFHCTAGKDRTGIAAALILLALGVPRSVVMQDYLLTNDLYQRPHVGPTDTPEEVLAVLWRVRPEFLNAALHSIDTEEGGLDSYLQTRMRLSPAAREALRTRCLQAR